MVDFLIVYPFSPIHLFTQSLRLHCVKSDFKCTAISDIETIALPFCVGFVSISFLKLIMMLPEQPIALKVSNASIGMGSAGRRKSF